MFKLTGIGPLPAADHFIDLRLAWLTEQLRAEQDLEEITLTDSDRDALANAEFEYEEADDPSGVVVQLSTEVWRPVEGYVGRYQVSNLGRVRSLERVVKHRGTGKMKVRGRLLKPSWRAGDPDAGHPSVSLSLNGDQKRHYLSRLVLSTFERGPEPGEIARFKNGDSTDVRLVNLRWGTRSEAATQAAATRKANAAAQGDAVSTLSRGSAAGVSWNIGRRA